MKYVNLFIVRWNPFPGEFYPASVYKPSGDEQATVFRARGLAFDTHREASERAIELNKRLSLPNVEGVL